MLLAAAALLGGCSGASPGAPAPDGGPPTTLAAPAPSVDAGKEAATDPAYRRFYSQRPVFSECGDALQCAAVTVPVDWDEPAGPTLDLSVVRRPARDQAGRLGSLLLNPGGPGVSGVDYVTERGDAATTGQVRERYDLVGFDPRGVGASEPVDCLGDAEMDAYLSFDPGLPADGQAPDPTALEEARARARELARGCSADAGALLAAVDTGSAARDLDVLRAVLGDERLDYVGRSYGTLLGATYAHLFPQRVGRMVLDGAMDPALSFVEVSLGQAAGLERALRAYVTGCPDRAECPLRGDVGDRLDQVRSVLDAARERPLRTDDPERPLTSPLALYGVVLPLYDSDGWPALDAALEQGLRGDGTALLELSDLYTGRQPDGAYAGNLLEAFVAVNCVDYPVDASAESMAATARRLAAASPTFGPALAYGELVCGEWPVPPAREPAPVEAQGAPPILVVGTTGDPATPHEWARSLAGQLDGARLLTFQGEGHTAYARQSRCVDAAVDAYLLDGVLPGEAATCRD